MTPVGLAIGAVGIALLVGPLYALLGRPMGTSEPTEDVGGSELHVDDLIRAWQLDTVLARAQVPAGSSAVGRTLDDLALRARYEVSVLEILRTHRDDESPRALPFSGRRHLHAGDVVTLKGPPGRTCDAISALCWDPVGDEVPTGPAGLSPATGLVEAVLTPRSRLLNRSLKAAHFRDRFGVNVLAIKRRGRVLTARVSRTRLRFGDSLLLTGPWTTIQSLRSERRDLVVAAPPSEMQDGLLRTTLAPAAIGIVVAMLVAMTAGWMPMAVTALLAAMAMVAAGCVTAPEAYRSVQWPSLVLLAAMLPVAIQVAATMGVAPTPFVVAVAVAASTASTAFATPVASPVNTLVLGPGHYRFADFVRVGVPLQLAALVVAALTIPVLFGF